MNSVSSNRQGQRISRLSLGAARIAASLLCLLGAARVQADANEVAGAAFNAKGTDPNRHSLAEFPFEHIDPMTGNLLLTFTDLALPGNAGFDLRIQRTYNSKIYATLQNPGGFTLIEDSWAGLGWTFHMGRVIGNTNVDPGPVIEMPDGSRHQLLPHLDGNSGHYLTKEFWTYEKFPMGGHPILRLPNGVRYTFGHIVNLNDLYVTSIEDAFGNSINIEYFAGGSGGPAPGDAIKTITQTLSEGQVRHVDFEYDATLQDASGTAGAAGSLRKMTLREDTSIAWTYTQKRMPNLGQTWLMSAQPPTGSPWTFNYNENPNQAPQFILLGLTTPNGGAINYGMQNTIFHLGSGITYSPAVVARQVTGSGVWNYSYTQLHLIDDDTFEPATIVTSPANVKTLHSFYEIEDQGGAKPWRLGLQHLRFTDYTVDASQVIVSSRQREELLWIPSPTISPEVEELRPATHAPLLQERFLKVQEANSPARFYTVISEYDTAEYSAARASNFADYGRPNRVRETGEISRTTDTTFFYGSTTDPSFDTYLVDKVASTMVCVGGDPANNCAGGERYASSYQYDPDTGFKTSQIVNGRCDTNQAASACMSGGESSTLNGTRTDYAATLVGDGNVETVADGEGNQTHFDYSWGVVKNTATPLYTITRTVNLTGTIASETRLRWSGISSTPVTTTFAYDSLLRQTSRRIGVSNPETTTYDPQGHFVSKVRGNSSMKTTLDGFGRPTGTEDGDASKTATLYNIMGLVSEQVLPFSGSYTPSLPRTRFEYDSLDRLTKRINPDSTFATIRYESTAAGPRITTTDEENRVTTQDFVAFGAPEDSRLVALTDADSKVTRYAYNAMGQLTAVAPHGFDLNSSTGVRHWSYNPDYRLESETHPEMAGSITYDYDDAGNMTSRSDPAFGETTFAYDPNNRLQYVVRDSAYDTHLEYDGFDHRILVSNGHVTSELSYDTNARIASRKDTIGEQVFTTSYDFNANDFLNKITYPTGGLAIYTTTPHQDRILKVTGSSGQVLGNTFTYHPSGALLSFKSGNNVVNTFTYDSLTQRLKTVNGVLGTSALFGLTYDYWPAGSVKSIVDGRGSSWNQSFGYDLVDRLTSAIGPWGTLGFTYDPQGNRTSQTLASQVTSYTYDASNRLQAYTGSQPFSGFQYDANGSTRQDATGVYTYAKTNLMETAAPVANPTQLTTYRYDGDDLRSMKILPSGEIRYYIHGIGGELLSEFRQPDPQNPATLEVVQDYVYAAGRLLASVKTSVFTTDVDSLFFAAVAGGPNPATQSVSVAHTPPKSVPWKVVSANPTWLSASPTSATGTPGAVTVSIDSSSLTPGVYTGKLTFSTTGTSANTPGSPRIVNVTLTVAAQPGLFVYPSSLSFSMQPNASDPAAKTLQVAYGGDSVPWAAVTSAPWISLTTAAGSTPGFTQAKVERQGRPEGTYTGTITVSSDGNDGSPKIVPVDFVVEPSGGHQCNPSSWYCEPFDGLNVGPLGGQGGWVTSSDRVPGQVSFDPRGVGRVLTLEPPKGQTVNEQIVLPEHPVDGTEFSLHMMIKDGVPSDKDVAKIEFYTNPVAWGKTKRTFGAVRIGSAIFLQTGPNLWQPIVPVSQSRRWYSIRVQYKEGQVHALVDGIEKYAGPYTLAPNNPVQGLAISGSDLRGIVHMDMIQAAFIVPPELQVSPGTMSFSVPQGGSATPQSFSVSQQGLSSGPSWTASADAPWIVLTSTSGFGPSTVPVNVNVAGLVPGTYTGSVTIDADADGSPQVVLVTLTVTSVGPMSVHGTVFTEDGGSVVPNAYVSCFAEPLGFGNILQNQTDTRADANGHYSFSNLVCPRIGPMRIVAYTPVGTSQRGWPGAVAFDFLGGNQTRDVYLARPGNFDVLVTDDSGGPCIALVNAGVSAFPAFGASGQTSPSGHISFTLPAEPQRLEGGRWSMFGAAASNLFPCSNPNQGAMRGANSTGPVFLGQANEVQVKVGADRIRPDSDTNGGYFTRGSQSMDNLGFVYFGTVEIVGPIVAVNDQPTGATGYWIEEIGGRGARIDAPVIQPITVKRHVYFPPNDQWFRSIDEFTNASSAPTTIRVKRRFLQGGLVDVLATGSGDTLVDAGDSYAITLDEGLSGSQATGFVFQNAHPTAVDAGISNSQFSQEWLITIPAGGRSLVMTYAFAKPADDLAGAQSLAQSLANLTATDATTGLSGDDLAHIVNFQ